jgi:hypothetical protein
MVCAFWAVIEKMVGLSRSETIQITLVLLLLLESSSLDMLVKGGLVVPFVLARGFLLHHVGARLTLSFLGNVLKSSLLLNIKRCYQIFKCYLLSLVLRVVAKFLYEGGNLAIIQPTTNLSGNTPLRILSPLAMHYI